MVHWSSIDEVVHYVTVEVANFHGDGRLVGCTAEMSPHVEGTLYKKLLKPTVKQTCTRHNNPARAESHAPRA